MDGSSPRTWGTPPLFTQFSVCKRFIPTDVGNSWKAVCRSLRYSVHPHGRGELLPVGNDNRGTAGSSPRTWGTPSTVISVYSTIRFIPTDVGNSEVPANNGPVLLVHPHGRGELITNPGSEAATIGSSPRTWGTPGYSQGDRDCGWFIPTDVGNSLSLHSGLTL